MQPTDSIRSHSSNRERHAGDLQLGRGTAPHPAFCISGRNSSDWAPPLSPGYALHVSQPPTSPSVGSLRCQNNSKKRKNKKERRARLRPTRLTGRRGGFTQARRAVPSHNPLTAASSLAVRDRCRHSGKAHATPDAPCQQKWGTEPKRLPRGLSFPR